MSFDVNKIIEESLKESSEVLVTESIEGSLYAAKRSAKAAAAAFTGGSSQDAAAAAKDYAEEASKKMSDGPPEGIVAKEYLKEVGKTARKASGTLDSKEEISDTAKKAMNDADSDKKEATPGMASKIAKVMEEHPGMSFAAAAAIAAGLGAMALRKKLSGVAKHKKEKLEK